MTNITVKTCNDLSKHVGQVNSKFLRRGHDENVAEPFYIDGNPKIIFMAISRPKQILYMAKHGN